MRKLVLIIIVFLFSFTSTYGHKFTNDTIKIKKLEFGIGGGIILYKNNKLYDNLFYSGGLSFTLGYNISKKIILGTSLSSYFGEFKRKKSYFYIDQKFSDLYISFISKFKFPLKRKNSLIINPIISENIIIFKKYDVILAKEDELKNKYFCYELGLNIGFQYDINDKIGLSTNYHFSYAQFWGIKNEINLYFLIKT